MQTKSIIALSICTIGFGVLQITDKFGVQAGASPELFSVVSFMAALVIVAPLYVAQRGEAVWRMPRGAWPYVIIIGILASGFGTVIAVTALQFTTATNKSIMQPFYAAFTVLFSFFAFGERLPKWFFLVLASMLLGLLLLTSDGFDVIPNHGDWLLFTTIPLVGFTNTLSKRLLQMVQPMQIVVWRYVFASLFVGAAIVLWHGVPTWHAITIGWPWAAASGVLAAIYATSMYYGMRSVGPSLTAAFISAGPAVTAVGSYIWLGERLSVTQVVGFIVVTICALLISRMQATYTK